MTENKFGYSVDKGVQAIEKERIATGMAAMYDDIWLPIEKEKREQVFEEAKQSVLNAVKEGRYARAEFILGRLRKHFDAERVRNQVEKFLPVKWESKPISETHSLVREFFSKEKLNEIIDDVIKTIKQSGCSKLNLIELYSLRQLDPVYFDREIFPMIAENVNKPHLQEGPSAFFLADIDPDWKEDPRAMKETIEVVRSFENTAIPQAEMYAIALKAFGEKFQNNFPFSEKDWDRCVAYVKQYQWPNYKFPMLSAMETIHPGRAKSENVRLPTPAAVEMDISDAYEQDPDFAFTEFARILNLPTE